MKIKKLNLMEAFRLASIINKYVDKIDPRSDAVDFISGIIEKISPEEYLQCVLLATQIDEKTIKKQLSLDVLSALIESLKENQILSLLTFYRSLGL